MSINPFESLNLQKIIEHWENIQERSTQKNMNTAFSLNFWQAVALTEASTGLIISIQPVHPTYQTNLTEDDLKIIEWALWLEFNEPCLINVLQFGTMPSPIQQMPTKQFVKFIWEMARINLKTTIPLISAYVERCQIIDIEGSDDALIIINVLIEKQQHLDALKAYDRYREIEEMLVKELGRGCKIRLIPPQP